MKRPMGPHSAQPVLSRLLSPSSLPDPSTGAPRIVGRSHGLVKYLLTIARDDYPKVRPLTVGDRLVHSEHRSRALVRSNGDENRPPDSGETDPPRDGP